MKSFTIEDDNTITAFASATEAKRGAGDRAVVFSSEDGLAAIATAWSGTRLVEIWNVLPGVTPVKKFTSRAVALQRIWKAIQQLEPAEPVLQASASGSSKPAREGTKKAAILALLRRPQGATLPEMQAAVGWQAHSVRGFLSNLNRVGTHIESSAAEGGGRAYRIERKGEDGGPDHAGPGHEA